MSLRLGRIFYANTRPVYYDFDMGEWPPWVRCTEGAPSTLNAMLTEGCLDVSPVSSVAYARHFREWLILPELSIASKGEVMSVLLASRLPERELEGRRIAISPDSETSVELLKLCLSGQGLTPTYEPKRVKGPGLPEDFAAALLIGDKALRWPRQGGRLNIMDLGLWWHELTGTPFVFAIWAVRRAYAAENPCKVGCLLKLLKKSLKRGMASLASISEKTAFDMGIEREQAARYFQCLKYSLDPEYKGGLLAFFRKLQQGGLLTGPVDLNFFRADR